MTRRRKSDLAANEAMWKALERGPKLRAILQDFYTRVYADSRLAHFFDGVTKERAIEKQYNFLAQIFTGEPIYFGERPRNAHHWMVISDELFDYREELMESCLRRGGLSEELIGEWRSAEEIFRKQIVKDAPIPKKIRGVELPLEGYEDIDIAIGWNCDGCGNSKDANTRGRYHVRTGQTYCEGCSPDARFDSVRPHVVKAAGEPGSSGG
ncbi:MAG: group 1 truncated hemoglobin [Myxococcales bacterium]|nr:group 1 truncated hemoglobin [Myxococcales bacterium]